MEKIKNFILPEHTNGIYMQEAISSVSLTVEIAEKINELINAYNTLSNDDTEWKLNQESNIRKAIVFIKDNLLNTLKDLAELYKKQGFFDNYVKVHTSQIEERLNNLLAKLKEGSTTLDAEIIDARVGADNVTYSTAGEAIRNQIENIFDIALNKVDMSIYNENTFIRKSNGTIATGENFRTTGPIEITHKHLYFVGLFHKFTDCDLINFYSSGDIKEKNFIGSFTPNVAGLCEIEIPEGATHFVVCTSVKYWGSTRLFFAGDSNIAKSIESITLKPIVIDSFTDGAYVRNTNGSVSKVDGYSYSTPIKLTHNKLYFKGKYNFLSATHLINFYTSNEVSFYGWLGGVTPESGKLTEITIPEGAKYIVISGNTETVKETTLFYSGDQIDNTKVKTIAEIMSKVIANNDTPIKIKLIGDSITNGLRGTGYTNNAENGTLIYGSNYVNTNGHCWGNSLKAYLEKKFNCSVVNYGVSGIGSDILLSKMSTLIEDDDDIIICAIGTNDRVIGNDAYLGTPRTRETIYRNLNGLYTYAKRNGKEIIFITPIPSSISDEENRIIHNEDIENLYTCLSVEKGIEIIPMYKKFVDYCESRGIEIDELLNDGLHPNDNGYDVMFYLICNSLGITTARKGATW